MESMKILVVDEDFDAHGYSMSIQFLWEKI